jgi:hypothetical protein
MVESSVGRITSANDYMAAVGCGSLSFFYPYFALRIEFLGIICTRFTNGRARNNLYKYIRMKILYSYLIAISIGS